MDLTKRADRLIKYKALLWLRVDQRCAFVATEVGSHSADVLGISEKKMIEIEVKTSIQDLRADAKKYTKHGNYLKIGIYANYSYQVQWVPTHFYYAVPASLIEQAREYLDGKEGFDKYGIINAEEFKVVKRAQWLHKNEPSSHVKFVCALRMGSELIRFHEAWI